MHHHQTLHPIDRRVISDCTGMEGGTDQSRPANVPGVAATGHTGRGSHSHVR